MGRVDTISMSNSKLIPLFVEDLASASRGVKRASNDRHDEGGLEEAKSHNSCLVDNVFEITPEAVRVRGLVGLEDPLERLAK